MADFKPRMLQMQREGCESGADGARQYFPLYHRRQQVSARSFTILMFNLRAILVLKNDSKNVFDMSGTGTTAAGGLT